MRRVLALLSVAALAAAGLATAGTATAAPGDNPSSGRSSTASERAAIRAYWTPERMAAAVPAERLVEGRPAPRGGPNDPAPTEQAKPSKPGSGSTAVPGATWNAGGAVVTTTGKVFFTLGGVNYVCSGSMVDGANDRTVMTAGHCVHEGEPGGDYASAWAFVPAYNGLAQNVRPFGTWPYRTMQTTIQWETSGDFDYDVAFATVDDGDSSRTAEEIVGKQAISFTQTSTNLSVYAFGYPQASPYTGTTLTYCSGPTSSDPYGANTRGLVCNMTGGSSGGPWYSAFDAKTGTGTAYSLNSYRYTSGPYKNRMFGPRLGAVAQSLFNTVSSTDTP